MNKAMIFPIHKIWVDKIFNEEKLFDFRNKMLKDLKVGTKIYWYETLGKKHIKTYLSSVNLYTIYGYNGSGMIVGEATVGEIYEIELDTRSSNDYITEFHFINTNSNKHKYNIQYDIDFMGYQDNQQYAIELTNVIKYDEEWQNYIMEDSELDDERWQNLEDAPTSPIPKEHFVSWNKAQKEYDYECPSCTTLVDTEWTCPECGVSLCYLTHAPKAPIYVVEK